MHNCNLSSIIFYVVPDTDSGQLTMKSKKRNLWLVIILVLAVLIYVYRVELGDILNVLWLKLSK